MTRTATTDRWAGPVFAALVLAGATVIAGQATGNRPTVDVAISAVAFLVYAATGGLIVFRRESHPTGWLLVLAGLAIVLADSADADIYAHLPFLSPVYITWVSTWAWAVVFALFSVLTLTFPSGKLPEGPGIMARLGRRVVWLLPVAIGINALTETLGGVEMASNIASPVGFLPEWLNYPALLTVIAVLFFGAASLVVKRRRTAGAERAQLTWVVFAFVLLAGSVVVTMAYVFVSIGIGADDPGDSAWTVTYMMMILLPVSFGVAVLRYRLYEIDRIVSRTVSYAVIVGLLAAVFLGAVTILSSFLPSGSDLAIAASTLAVAALFNPLRRRVRDRVERRFNRSRFDMQRVMDQFATSLRDEVEIDRLREGWLGVVTSTMQPDVAVVWMRE